MYKVIKKEKDFTPESLGIGLKFVESWEADPKQIVPIYPLSKKVFTYNNF